MTVLCLSEVHTCIVVSDDKTSFTVCPMTLKFVIPIVR